MDQRATVCRRYPLEIKAEIVRAGHTNLFPHLNIPRTTAAYWISKKQQLASTTNIDTIYQDKITFLEKELEKEKALRALVETVRAIFPFDFATTRIRSKEIKQSSFLPSRLPRNFINLKLACNVFISHPGYTIAGYLITKYAGSPKVQSISVFDFLETHPKNSFLSTVANLKLARENALKEFQNLSTNIMMDGGPENKNQRVLKFIESSNMKRVIARTDIEFSNSMVEAFFRSLKNNFLYHQKFETIKDLEKKLRFYFKQHNE